MTEPVTIYQITTAALCEPLWRLHKKRSDPEARVRAFLAPEPLSFLLLPRGEAAEPFAWKGPCERFRAERGQWILWLNWAEDVDVAIPWLAVATQEALEATLEPA